MPFGFLALLAAFGTLANSLRSNSASALIRTLLRCSARPNGGLEYPTARPLRELRPNGLLASLTSRSAGVASFLTPHCSQRHGTPCPYGLTHRATTRVAPTTSLLRPHSSLHPVIPGLPRNLPSSCCPYLAPCTSWRSGTGTARRAPTTSLLTPHSSLLFLQKAPIFRLGYASRS